MECFQEIERVKKQFKLPLDEFLKGEWLQTIRNMFNYDKLDMSYQGDELIVRFYKKTFKGENKNGQ